MGWGTRSGRVSFVDRSTGPLRVCGAVIGLMILSSCSPVNFTNTGLGKPTADSVSGPDASGDGSGVTPDSSAPAGNAGGGVVAIPPQPNLPGSPNAT